MAGPERAADRPLRAGSRRAPAASEGAAPTELVAERLVGPYPRPSTATSPTPSISARIASEKRSLKEARLVIYDDTLPRSITVAFAAAGAGAIALVTGSIMLFFGLFRSSRGGTRRQQIV